MYSSANSSIPHPHAILTGQISVAQTAVNSLHSNSDSRQPFDRRSSLYKEFQAEREEILRHKWLESEKAGHDIGFETALLDWLKNHKEKWRSARRVAR